MFKTHLRRAGRLLSAIAFSIVVLLVVPFAGLFGYHVSICPSGAVGWAVFFLLVLPLAFPFIGVLAVLILVGLVAYVLPGFARYLPTGKTALAMVAVLFFLGLLAAQFEDSASSSCSLSDVR